MGVGNRCRILTFNGFNKDYLNNKFENFQSQSLSIKLLQKIKINLDEKGFASAIF
jgi:hypothetical protein